MRISDLFEAPIPDDWDKEPFSPKATFKSMREYVLANAKRLGAGSSRIAVEIPYKGRATVLKCALNAKGLSQNAAEINILDDGYLGGGDLTIPMIDFDTEVSPKWLHVEKAEKIKKSDFKEVLDGVSFDDAMKYLSIQVDINTKGRSYFAIDDDIKKALNYNEFMNSLVSLCIDAELEPADFARTANWGIYDGRPVIIDLGFTKVVRLSHYR